MAVIITLYNHTVKKLVNEEFNFATWKVLLLDASAAFDATHTTKAQVLSPSPNPEVYGNGWTEGGEVVANVAATTITTNDAKIDGDDVSKTASGGSIGPAYFALLYDGNDNSVIAWIDFGGLQEAGDATDFKFIWSANGILTFTYT